MDRSNKRRSFVVASGPTLGTDFFDPGRCLFYLGFNLDRVLGIRPDIRKSPSSFRLQHHERFQHDASRPREPLRLIPPQMLDQKEHLDLVQPSYPLVPWPAPEVLGEPPSDSLDWLGCSFFARSANTLMRVICMFTVAM